MSFQERGLKGLYCLFVWFLVALQYIIYILTIFVYVGLLASQCPAASEGLLFEDSLDVGLIELRLPDEPLPSEIYDLDINSYDFTFDTSDMDLYDFDNTTSDDYDPFQKLKDIYPKYSDISVEIIAQNKANFETNTQSKYDIFEIGEQRFIISNGYIFDSEFFKTLSDISLDITENTVDGNRMINLTIDSEVANAYFDLNPIDSGNSLFSGLSEARYAATVQYENEIRNIRSAPSVIFSSPELREFMVETCRSGSFSIIEASPASSFEAYIPTDNDLSELASRNQMRVD